MTAQAEVHVGGAPNVVPAVSHSVTPGAVWPAWPARRAAELLALRFQLERSQWWPQSYLRAQQFDQLRCVLDHALRTVPFYQDRPGQPKFDGECELTPELWQTWPLLTRRDIQDAGARLHSSRVPEQCGPVRTTSTSGSTGTPVTTRRAAIEQRYFAAVSLREVLWHKRDFNGKLAVIRHDRSGRPFSLGGVHAQDWANSAATLYRTGPSVMLDIFFEPATQAQWLMSEAPDYLMSLPSNLRAIALFAREHDVRLPPAREILVFGEAFDADFPDLCYATWTAKVTPIYSAEEVGIIGLWCPDDSHYHVQAETMFVEVLDDSGRPCGPGEIGRVVVTPLHNLAMPLIRYAIGDNAEVGEPCRCGRGLPVLKRVLGRTRNVLTLPSGEKRYAGISFRLSAKVPAIVQQQFVQKSLEEIEIRLVARRPLTADEENMFRNELARIAGEGIRIKFAYVSEIARSREGKYEDFLSEIA